MSDSVPSVPMVTPIPEADMSPESMLRTIQALRVAVETLLGLRVGLAAQLSDTSTEPSGLASRPLSLNWMPPQYTLATLPPPLPARQLAFISDESGGFVLAFSDGTNWLRVTDRAVAS